MIEVVHTGENHDFSPYVDFHIPKWPESKIYLCLSLKEIFFSIGYFYVQIARNRLTFADSRYFWESKRPAPRGEEAV